MNNNHYVPALKYAWLTRFYDPVVALTTRETTFRQRLLEQSELKAGDRLLDLACGTGTFAVLVKARYPETVVTGLDGDPDILELARKRAQKAGVDVVFDEGLSYSMPYQASNFDIVFSSLFFHHLQTRDKMRTLKEVIRVLKPGGKFHICDWGNPSNLLSKVMFTAVRLLDGFSVTQDNVDGRLSEFLGEAGFVDISVTDHIETMLGTLDLITAKKSVG